MSAGVSLAKITVTLLEVLIDQRLGKVTLERLDGRSEIGGTNRDPDSWPGSMDSFLRWTCPRSADVYLL